MVAVEVTQVPETFEEYAGRAECTINPKLTVADERKAARVVRWDIATHIIDDLPIQKVSVAILESFPVQANLMIEGYLADSCTTLHETTERREGNTIHVQVTTKRPRDLACAAVISITEIEHVVSLGTFDPGLYKAIVNSGKVAFEVH